MQASEDEEYQTMDLKKDMELMTYLTMGRILMSLAHSQQQAGGIRRKKEEL